MSEKRFNVRTLLIFACAICTLVYGAWLFISLFRFPTDGCGGAYVDQGIMVNQLSPWPTGLETGDLIIDVNGQNIRHNLFTPNHWRQLFFEDPSSTASYIVLRNGQEVEVVVPWKTFSVREILPRSSAFLFLGVLFVLSGAFVAWRRGEEVAARLMAVALIGEGFNLINNLVLTMGINTGVSFAWFSLPLDWLSFSLVFSSFFHCFLVFPEVKWLGKRFPRLLYLVHPLTLAVGIVSGVLWSDGTTLSIRSKTLTSLYVITGFELVVGVGHMVHTYFTTRKPGVRNQIRWLIWGMVMGALPWFVFYNIAYIVLGKPLLPLYLVAIPLLLIPLALIFSVARYGLMAIDTLINRSLVYGVLTVILVTVSILIATLLNNVLGELGAVAVSTLVAVVTVGAIRNYLQRLIDRIFYKGRLNFEHLLEEMGERLTTTLVFNNLATLLTEYIPTRLQLGGAILFTVEPVERAFMTHPPQALSLFRDSALAKHLQQHARPISISQFRHPPPDLADEMQRLAQAGMEICLPLRRAEKLIGIYVLGRKQSGDLYDNKELDILALLSHQISSALENTRLYREVEEYSRTLESQVEARTRDLRRANKKLADTAWDLAEQRARLDAILQNIADGLVVTDFDGDVVLTNAVFEQIVQLEGGKLRGMPLQKVFPGQGLMDIVQQARVNVDRPFSGEVVSTAGHVYKASSCALLQGTTLTGVTTVLRDITREVEIDRMKTDFISTVSHELRTPLTSVLGFAKLIQRSFESVIVSRVEPDDRKGQRAVTRILRNLDIIESESQRLTRLINDVLDIAKMEAGKIEWHMSNVDIEKVINGAVSASTALIADTPLQLQVEIEPDLPPATADLDRIIQVVTNLLSNAIKFTDQGEITVRAWQLDPGDDIVPFGERAPDLFTGLPVSQTMLAVSVSDTGVGIQAEDLPKVFDRFKQVGDVLTSRPRGTGLGLPICREIVEHHGGHIWVESMSGEGSRFVFTLPLEAPREADESQSVPAKPEPQDVAPVPVARKEEAVSQPAPRLLPDIPAAQVQEIRRQIYDNLPPGTAGQTILVVDDDASIRLLLAQELNEAGYQVIEAAEGLTAVELARTRQPDLILLDVMMPGLSGFDVTSVLKADERTRHIPILILSIIEDREKGFRLGADEYLTKPVHSEKLLEAISTLLLNPTQGQRALVVHHDESVLEAITRVLRERGFDVITAYDSRGAIEKAQEVQPDLVVLDAMLSEVCDYPFFKALNYQNQQRQMGIFVLSGELDQTEPQDQEIKDNL